MKSLTGAAAGDLEGWSGCAARTLRGRTPSPGCRCRRWRLAMVGLEVVDVDVGERGRPPAPAVYRAVGGAGGPPVRTVARQIPVWSISPSGDVAGAGDRRSRRSRASGPGPFITVRRQQRCRWRQVRDLGRAPPGSSCSVHGEPAWASSGRTHRSPGSVSVTAAPSANQLLAAAAFCRVNCGVPCIPGIMRAPSFMQTVFERSSSMGGTMTSMKLVAVPAAPPEAMVRFCASIWAKRVLGDAGREDSRAEVADTGRLRLFT